LVYLQAIRIPKRWHIFNSLEINTETIETGGASKGGCDYRSAF